MKISPEYLIERRRNRSFVRRWKMLALLSTILLFVFFSRSTMHNVVHNIGLEGYESPNEQYIATVSINDVIFDDAKRDKKLKEIAESKNIQALIVTIDSPGGTVVGSEILYNSLRKISAKIPVVAVLGSIATSGGYFAALGADYIISHNGTITGSIGVLLQSAEITGLGEKIGVTFNNFKSGTLKASPNLTEKVTKEVREAVMDTINDVYTYFTELVSERRKIGIDEVKKIADGRVYSAKAALKLKLIDKIGNMDDAIKWLETEKKISNKLPIREVKFHEVNPFIKILDEVNSKISFLFNSGLIKGLYM